MPKSNGSTPVRSQRQASSAAPSPVAGDLNAMLDAQRVTARNAVVERLRIDRDGTPVVGAGLQLGAAGLVLPLLWWATIMFRPDMTSVIGRARLGPDPIMMMLLVAPAAMMIAAAKLPRRVHRGRVVSVGALAAALCTLAAAVGPAATSPLLLLVAVAVAAAASVVHVPLLFDLCPPARRREAVGYQFISLVAAPVIAVALVEGTATLGLTWRVGLLAVAVVAAVAGLGAVRLVDPGVGVFEAKALRDALPAPSLDDDDGPEPLGAVLVQVFTSPSARPILEAAVVLGALVATWAVFVPNLLDEAWQVPRGGRFTIVCAVALLAAVLVVAVGRLEHKLGTSGRALRSASGFLDAAALSVAVGALVTVFSIAVVELVVGIAIGVAVVPLLWHALLHAVAPSARAHGAALLGSASFLGIIQGYLLVGSIDVRFGASWGVAVGGVLLAVGAGALRRSARSLDGDTDAVIDAAVEERTVTLLRAERPLPLLVCRNVDFSYGSLQVLFGVNLTVEQGEMVALLGTNGAGKSTLLRVISGLAIPQRGSVRLGGDDITFVAAEERVADGIVQIPGGRGVFGPLSVVENLRLHGYVLGRDRGTVDRGVDDVFSAFPRLAERRNQPASTLSGGEQQMLALGKALILRPRLLLIDELSLGLAPKIVGELLEMVRAINATGTAVVLVEQSVNIALTLAHHAYFMEKGEMRFDGPAQELLQRGDLLRSVFLGGVAAATAAGVSV